MAYAPSHRPTQSISSNNLLPPTTPDQKRERRMTSPNLGQSSGRPPSPLRNGFVANTSTGIDLDAMDDDDDDEDEDDEDEDDFRRGRDINRSPSPASSVSQMAASFAQRMGNLVSGMASPSPSPGLPSDAELEAEAERERDRTRREAERILYREAAGRKQVEDRVLAMLDSTRALPSPPARAQTMPNPETPSPSGSQKDSTSWWSAAKNRLTPTKELTPAQQVIQEAKTREKEMKKQTKGKEKDMSTLKASDAAALLNLNIPATPQQPPRRPTSASPASPTPSRSNMAPNLSPSPMRSGEAGTSSPSREAPPLYAQFNAQGTLDVHVTLLTIAKRFEKLEKWTVGHVRALEERMGDVERWLVDKEKAKEDAVSGSSLHATEPQNSEAASAEMRELREEIVELQGRIGEIGREMARLATAPNNLSSNRSRQSAEVAVSSSTRSPSVNHERVTSSSAEIVDPDETFQTATPQAHRRVPSLSARQSTSPPMASSKASIGSRLPYPTGDYASPPNSAPSGFFSPTNSPPSSVNKSRPVSMNVTGLPPTAPQNQIPPLSSASSSYSMASFSTASSISPAPGSNGNMSMTSPSTSPQPGGKSSRGLPVPPHQTSSSSLRQSSTSPTPRKRYTVALGGPLVPPDDYEEEEEEQQQQQSNNRPSTPHSGRGKYTSSPTDFQSNGRYGHDGGEEDEFEDETIGKSKSAKVSSGLRANGDSTTPSSIAQSLPSSPSNHRMRAQSAYGLSSIQAQSPNTMAELPSVAPLRPRVRSKSTDRLDRGSRNSTFVDPLVLRKQEAAARGAIAMPKPMGRKVAVGQLVAFFDGERK
ncbi:hypothetical protein V5O48_008542 [Marasmius crinis-equi]|uniref:Uncharacterized protein n=1 Tax=Marasmius crinis-equi TaxID=585013 RepID=A0ABR3FDM9_9AGAR